MANRNILLIEPGYKNKYPPLGLMKIAQYHGEMGKNDLVKFLKGEDKSVLSFAWDRIYITSLFSFEWKKTADSINFALKAANGHADRIFVGGIAASLMNEAFKAEPSWRGIRFIQGLLDNAPAISLQLDDFSEELYSDDYESTPIEFLTPDYSILEQIDYDYSVTDAYFTYASRGCVRSCKFCGVPKLEGKQRDTDSISQVVGDIEKLYGPKKDLILMDNNVTASGKFKEIMAEIRDLGFQKGATLTRNGTTAQRRVDFNQGVDARILCKDPMFLQEMSTICLSPLRIAFDHAGLRKPYETAIRFAADAGLSNLSNYMLYNFHDSPEDLYERMKLNIHLNEELGIRIFSFPMRYQPVDLKDRSHIGQKWNRYLLRSMQLILQATHGIVSGAPSYFRRAFGDSESEFKELLALPHKFIFNRTYYEELDGKPELIEYKSEYAKLNDSEKEELVSLISDRLPKQYPTAVNATKNSKIKKLIPFFYHLNGAVERKIWDQQAEYRKRAKVIEFVVPEDEKVEDAGLEVA
ncbi:MAG: radical SAM protein [Pseudomonadales bacterium]|nr:radical SAM protein [Pseudomonadales bacterium]